MLAFAIVNADKDVGYYSRMADEAGVDSVMSKGTQASLNAAVKDGRGDDMVSTMVDYYADRFKPKG